MNQEQFYRIEAYLRGEMTASEKAAFEAELVADPALAEQLAAQQVQRRVAEIFIEDELRAEAKKWRADLEDGPPPTPEKNVRLWWWVSIAAALLVLLLCFLFLQRGELPKPPIENSESEELIYASPHRELLLDTILTLASSTGIVLDSIELLVYDAEGKPSYSFDGAILELQIPKDSLDNAQELRVLKSEKNTGEIFYLKMKNNLYPIFQTDTLSEMKRL